MASTVVLVLLQLPMMITDHTAQCFYSPYAKWRKYPCRAAPLGPQLINPLFFLLLWSFRARHSARGDGEAADAATNHGLPNPLLAFSVSALPRRLNSRRRSRTRARTPSTQAKPPRPQLSCTSSCSLHFSTFFWASSAPSSLKPSTGCHGVEWRSARTRIAFSFSLVRKD